MTIFDNVFGNWIQIIDNKNNLTIEDYGYNTGVVDGTTDNHCTDCVAINKCYFKNEKDKKPSRTYKMPHAYYLSQDTLPGLYHVGCHCEELSAELPNTDAIKLIVPSSKIDYMYSKKASWIKAMGYHEPDYETFTQMLLQKTKEAYFWGKYYIVDWTKYGCKINLKIDVSGINEKIGKTYKIITNYMVFPNGQLKMNTPIGGWQK